MTKFRRPFIYMQRLLYLLVPICKDEKDNDRDDRLRNMKNGYGDRQKAPLKRNGSQRH